MRQRGPTVSLFDDDEDTEAVGGAYADTGSTLTPAQKLLVYCDAVGIAVQPARTPGKVTVALEPLPPKFRKALDECAYALRALVDTIPTGGWRMRAAFAVHGGAGVVSLLGMHRRC